MADVNILLLLKEFIGAPYYSSECRQAEPCIRHMVVSPSGSYQGTLSGGNDMANITRRNAIALAAGAAGSLGLAHAADRSSGPGKGATTAGIERYEPSPSMPGIPLISFAVVHGNIAYLAGVTANPADLGDIKDQTHQVTARIDALLAKAGTSKA